MKILVFTTLFPNNVWPNHGVFIKERMIRVAKLDGCTIKVLAPVPYYPPIRLGWRQSFSQVQKRENVEGLEVFHPRYVMTPKVGMIFYGWLMFISILPFVIKLTKTFNFDLIDTHYVYPDGLAGVLLGRYFRKPVVLSARGSDINLYSNLPLIRGLLRYSLLKADKIISVCQALKDEMTTLNISPEKVCVIPNGVDINKFYPIPQNKARQELTLAKGKKVILSVGSLIQRKRFDLLIKAMKVLIEKFHKHDVYLVIAGEGELRRRLEMMISSLNLSDHVSLVGNVPHQELCLWYNAADLFCLTSSREGWPNVIMEALACGKPVVATNIWGIPEILHSDKIGLLTEGNEHRIAETIAIAFEKQWHSDEITAYARKHTWDQTATSVFEVFKSVTERNTSDHTIGKDALIRKNISV